MTDATPVGTRILTTVISFLASIDVSMDTGSKLVVVGLTGSCRVTVSKDVLPA